MPKPYSYDLRKKVIDAIELDGLKKTEASTLFNISRNTINLWLKRKEETGNFAGLPNQPPVHGHKIGDWSYFPDFVAKYGHLTQEEMATLWPEKISSRTISRGERQNRFYTKKRMLP